MKENKYPYGCFPLIITLILIALIGHAIFGCTKGIEPRCQAVTYKFENGDTVIHWCKVCDSELEKFKAMPVRSEVIPGCDSRIQILTIGIDNCKK